VTSAAVVQLAADWSSYAIGVDEVLMGLQPAQADEKAFHSAAALHGSASPLSSREAVTLLRRMGAWSE
jgi:hypothetical protein